MNFNRRPKPCSTKGCLKYFIFCTDSIDHFWYCDLVHAILSQNMFFNYLINYKVNVLIYIYSLKKTLTRSRHGMKFWSQFSFFFPWTGHQTQGSRSSKMFSSFVWTCVTTILIIAIWFYREMVKDIDSTNDK